jgi:hypothetical protein
VKAISVEQPFATLIVLGVKQHMARSWVTQHRGPLLIHAARPFGDAARQLCCREPFRSVLKQAGYAIPADLPRGVVLGTVELCNCLHAHAVPLPPEEEPFRDVRPGWYVWLLKGARRLAQPIPLTGRQGIYEVSEEVMRSPRAKPQSTQSPDKCEDLLAH